MSSSSADEYKADVLRKLKEKALNKAIQSTKLPDRKPISGADVAQADGNEQIAAILSALGDDVKKVLQSVPPPRMKEVLVRLCNRETEFRDLPDIHAQLKAILSNNKENEQPSASVEPASDHQMDDSFNGSNSSSIIPSNSLFTSTSNECLPKHPDSSNSPRNSISPVPQPVMPDCSIVVQRPGIAHKSPVQPVNCFLLQNLFLIIVRSESIP